MNPLAKFVCAFLVASTFAQTTSGFYTPIRTVEYCNEIGDDIARSSCDSICIGKFSKVLETRKETKNKLQSLIILKEGKRNCCCRFDDFWEISPENDWNTSLKKIFKVKWIFVHPLPLQLREDKKLAYNAMRHYLGLSRPMTMLELEKLLEAVAYLRRVGSRHYTVNLELRHKYVENIGANSYSTFGSYIGSLIDHPSESEQPAEIASYVDELNKIKQNSKELREAIKSYVVDKALDELVVSKVMTNVINANKKLELLNKTIPEKTFEKLILGQNPFDWNVTQFDNLDDFSKTRGDLIKLQTSIEKALNSLSVADVYVTMSNQWKHMIRLNNTIKAYTNLLKYSDVVVEEGSDKI